MKRSVLLILLAAFLLAACGTTSELPQSLPTVVVPADLPQQTDEDTAWSIAFTYPMVAGKWSIGLHRYAFRTDCPLFYDDIEASWWTNFDVFENSQYYQDPVYFRLQGPSNTPLGGNLIFNINPNQHTVARITFLGISKEVAEQAAAECTVDFFSDSNPPEPMLAGDPFRP